MAALFIVGGGSLGIYIAELQFWKKLAYSRAEARSIMSVLESGVRVIRAGIVLFFISGILMLWQLDFVYLKQPWFLFKLALVISLPVRGAAIGGRLLIEMRNEVNKHDDDGSVFAALRQRMLRFHYTQYSIVIGILFLVIFKP